MILQNQFFHWKYTCTIPVTDGDEVKKKKGNSTCKTVLPVTMDLPLVEFHSIKSLIQTFFAGEGWVHAVVLGWIYWEHTVVVGWGYLMHVVMGWWYLMHAIMLGWRCCVHAVRMGYSRTDLWDGLCTLWFVCPLLSGLFCRRIWWRIICFLIWKDNTNLAFNQNNEAKQIEQSVKITR